MHFQLHLLHMTHIDIILILKIHTIPERQQDPTDVKGWCMNRVCERERDSVPQLLGFSDFSFLFCLSSYLHANCNNYNAIF